MGIQEIKTELDKLGKKITQVERDLSQSQGSTMELMKRLKDEHGFKTVEEAKKWLALTKPALEKEEKDIVRTFEKMKKDYDL